MYSDISDHVAVTPTRKRTRTVENQRRRPMKRKAAEDAAEIIVRLCRFRPQFCVCGEELDNLDDEEFQILVLECEDRFTQHHVINSIGDADSFAVCEEPTEKSEVVKVEMTPVERVLMRARLMAYISNGHY